MLTKKKILLSIIALPILIVAAYFSMILIDKADIEIKKQGIETNVTKICEEFDLNVPEVEVLYDGDLSVAYNKRMFNINFTDKRFEELSKENQCELFKKISQIESTGKMLIFLNIKIQGEDIVNIYNLSSDGLALQKNGEEFYVSPQREQIAEAKREAEEIAKEKAKQEAEENAKKAAEARAKQAAEENANKTHAVHVFKKEVTKVLKSARSVEFSNKISQYDYMKSRDIYIIGAYVDVKYRIADKRRIYFEVCFDRTITGEDRLISIEEVK